MSTPIQDLTAKEAAEAATSAQAAKDRLHAELHEAAKVVTGNTGIAPPPAGVSQPVEGPPSVAAPAPVAKPTIFGRLKAEVQHVEQEIKDIATEIEDKL